MEVRLAHMADFGVVLLMFTLGLEFSLGELRYLRRAAFVGGPLQMAATVVPAAILGRLSGLPWPAAITSLFLRYSRAYTPSSSSARTPMGT